MDLRKSFLHLSSCLVLGFLLLLTGCKSQQVNKKPFAETRFSPAHAVYPLRDFNAWRDQAIHTETMQWRIPATVYMEGIGIQMLCFGLGKEIDEGILTIFYSDSRMGISLMNQLGNMEPQGGPYHIWVEGNWDFEVGGYDGQMTFFIRKVSPRSEREKKDMWVGLEK